MMKGLLILMIGFVFSSFAIDVMAENSIKFFEYQGTVFYYYKDSIKKRMEK